MIIYFIALGLLLWLLLEEEQLVIRHDTMWRDHPWVLAFRFPEGKPKRGHFVWNPSHGPQSWPWWRLLSVTVVPMNGQCCDPGKKRVGYRVWCYSRWVDSHLDLLWHVGGTVPAEESGDGI